MTYAIRIDGDWHEVRGSFTDADGGQYPPNWIELATPAEIEAIGLVEIAEERQPEGLRILTSTVVDVEGVPTRSFETEPLTEGDLIDLINARLGQAFAAGFAPSHPSFEGERLQVRDSEDRTNWLTSQAAYTAAVSQGAGDVLDATFRTMNNQTITVSYADGLAVLLEMAAWGKALMGHSWALKDALAAGEPVEIEIGWP